MRQAGLRAQQAQQAAAQDIEQPVAAETGLAAGALEALGGAAATALAPEAAIPAALALPERGRFSARRAPSRRQP